MTPPTRLLVAAYTVAALASGALVYAVWTRALGLNPGALVDLCLLAGIGWLWWDRATVHDRTDSAIDTADLALGKVEAVENHLTGLEAPGRGRHARPTPQPRAVA